MLDLKYKMNVTIIDKDDFQRHILLLLLSSAGFENVSAFSSFEDVVDNPGENKTFFIDVNLFLEKKIPLSGLIIVTGQEREDKLIANAFENGAHSFLPKPFTKEGLETALKDAKLIFESIHQRAAVTIMNDE